MMYSLLLAAILPALYWDQGPETASALQRAGIEKICVPAARAAAWNGAGVAVTPLEEAALARLQKTRVPRVQYRVNIASATRLPWVDANGWRFVRDPKSAYLYELPAGAAPLAASEAFAYGVEAVLRIDPADLEALGRTLRFLREIDSQALPGMANIGVIDDGTPLMGEALNMMARRNLLFRIVPAPDPALRLTVRLGTPEYPREAARNPGEFAQKVRQRLTDEERLLRIYGADTVIGRLEGDGSRARLHLLNYANRTLAGMRVRVRGVYRKGELRVPGAAAAALADYIAEPPATEFTIPEMTTYAVVDLR